jgi:hypothetical protein
MFKGPFHLPRQEWICWHMLNLFLDSGDAVMKKKSEFHSNSTQQ